MTVLLYADGDCDQQRGPSIVVRILCAILLRLHLRVMRATVMLQMLSVQPVDALPASESHLRP